LRGMGSTFIFRRNFASLRLSPFLAVCHQLFLHSGRRPLPHCAAEIGMPIRKDVFCPSLSPEHLKLFPISISHCERGLSK